MQFLFVKGRGTPDTVCCVAEAQEVQGQQDEPMDLEKAFGKNSKRTLLTYLFNLSI